MRTWFMIRQEFEKLHTADVAHNIFSKDLPIDSVPLHVFTPLELKEHDREVAQSVWWDAMEHKIRGVVDEFATYWRERMEGEK